MDKFRQYEPCPFKKYNSLTEAVYDLKENLNKVVSKNPGIYFAYTSALVSAELELALEKREHNHYYKISSKIIPALLNTKINSFDLKDFKLPYPLIEILFPKGSKIDAIKNGELRSIIAWERTITSGEQFVDGRIIPIKDMIRQFVFSCQWRTFDDKTVLADSQMISYFSDQGTIADAIDRVNLTPRLPHEQAYGVEHNLTNRAALIFGICLLATGKHRYVEPDVLTIHREEYLNTDDINHRNKLIRQAQDRNINGNLVGFRYTVIPGKDHSNSIGTGQELKYSHWRTGHFRRIPAGEIIWIEPMLIRPDLPPDPRKRQYVVK